MILTFGIQGGLQYENEIIIAENDRKRQEIENARLKSIAVNEKEMAEERVKAVEAYEVQRNLDRILYKLCRGECGPLSQS